MIIKVCVISLIYSIAMLIIMGIPTSFAATLANVLWQIPIMALGIFLVVMEFRKVKKLKKFILLILIGLILAISEIYVTNNSELY